MLAGTYELLLKMGMWSGSVVCLGGRRDLLMMKERFIALLSRWVMIIGRRSSSSASRWWCQCRRALVVIVVQLILFILVLYTGIIIGCIIGMIIDMIVGCIIVMIVKIVVVVVVGRGRRWWGWVDDVGRVRCGRSTRGSGSGSRGGCGRVRWIAIIVTMGMVISRIEYGDWPNDGRCCLCDTGLLYLDHNRRRGSRGSNDSSNSSSTMYHRWRATWPTIPMMIAIVIVVIVVIVVDIVVMAHWLEDCGRARGRAPLLLNGWIIRCATHWTHGHRTCGRDGSGSGSGSGCNCCTSWSHCRSWSWRWRQGWWWWWGCNSSSGSSSICTMTTITITIAANEGTCQGFSRSTPLGHGHVHALTALFDASRARSLLVTLFVHSTTFEAGTALEAQWFQWLLLLLLRGTIVIVVVVILVVVTVWMMLMLWVLWALRVWWILSLSGEILWACPVGDSDGGAAWGQRRGGVVSGGWERWGGGIGRYRVHVLTRRRMMIRHVYRGGCAAVTFGEWMLLWLMLVMIVAVVVLRVAVVVVSGSGCCRRSVWMSIVHSCCYLLVFVVGVRGWDRKCGSLVEYVMQVLLVCGVVWWFVLFGGIVYRCAVVCDLRVECLCVLLLSSRRTQATWAKFITPNNNERRSKGQKVLCLGVVVGKWRMMMSGTGKHGGRRGTCRKVFDYCGQLTP